MNFFGQNSDYRIITCLFYKHFPNDTIRVRLLIYSGREDPTWSVSPFSRLYRNISYLMQRPTPSPQNSFPSKEKFAFCEYLVIVDS